MVAIFGVEKLIMVEMYSNSAKKFVEAIILFIEHKSAVHTFHNFHILKTIILGIGSYFKVKNFRKE